MQAEYEPPQDDELLHRIHDMYKVVLKAGERSNPLCSFIFCIECDSQDVSFSRLRARRKDNIRPPRLVLAPVLNQGVYNLSYQRAAFLY
jgi:hypothetical protein